MSENYENYDADFDSEDEYEKYEEYCEDDEKLNLTEEIADLSRLLKKETLEIDQAFGEAIGAFEEYNEVFGDDLADDPDFIKDNMAFTNIKIAGKVIVNTFRYLSSFLGAASGLLGANAFGEDTDTDDI